MRTVRVALAALLVAGTAGVLGAETDPACLLDARAEAKACRAACVEGYQTDRDACRNVDHACAEACRAGRARCTEPFEATLDGCIDVCREQLRLAKDTCPPEEGPARDACIDPFQVVAFVCRDDCRENQAVRDGIRNCRAAFRACVRVCPPAVTN